MSAAIDQTTGRAAIFVTGSPAWHRLGIQIDNAATSAEAIKLAALDWTVEQWPIRAFNPDNPSQEAGIPERVANVRSDTRAVLGVVSRGYKVFDNVEAFDFMDALVSDRLAMYETAGAIHGGRRVWMLARIPKEYRASGDDVVKPYVLLTTGHDGRSPVQMLATSVRVVCQNTLNLALRAGAALTVSHYKSMDGRIQEARQKLGIVVARFDQMDEEMHAMLDRSLSVVEATQYFRDRFETPEGDRATSMRDRKVDRLLANFDNELNSVGRMRHTAWAAYNAVSEYADHQKDWRGRSDEAKANSQLESIWFGGAHDLKTKAYADALALSK